MFRLFFFSSMVHYYDDEGYYTFVKVGMRHNSGLSTFYHELLVHALGLSHVSPDDWKEDNLFSNSFDLDYILGRDRTVINYFDELRNPEAEVRYSP